MHLGPIRRMRLSGELNGKLPRVIEVGQGTLLERARLPPQSFPRFFGFEEKNAIISPGEATKTCILLIYNSKNVDSQKEQMERTKEADIIETVLQKQ
ncbi:hypothetical protein TNCV_3844701 [Trichonephila clavipes]|nr:hypothetical protein TNCV_3844701 [Trichonephila clavipes]